MMKQPAEYHYAAGAIFTSLRRACRIMSSGSLERYMVNTHGIKTSTPQNLICWINDSEEDWSAASRQIHERHRDSELLQAWRTENTAILAAEADRLHFEAVQIRGAIFLGRLAELDEDLRPQLERAIDRYYSEHRDGFARNSFQLVAKNSSDEEFREVLKASLLEHTKSC